METLREKYPMSDWQYEVANGDTVLGYEEWLLHCKERDEHDQHSERGYDCTVSCAYSAESPCAAARDFLADLGRPNAPWCVSVRNLDNNQQCTVSLPFGNVEESDEAWPGEHEGISAMAGDDHRDSNNKNHNILARLVELLSLSMTVRALDSVACVSERHHDIVSIAIELFEQGKNSTQVNRQLRDGYGYTQTEIMTATFAHIRQIVKK